MDPMLLVAIVLLATINLIALVVTGRQIRNGIEGDLRRLSKTLYKRTEREKRQKRVNMPNTSGEMQTIMATIESYFPGIGRLFAERDRFMKVTAEEEEEEEEEEVEPEEEIDEEK